MRPPACRPDCRAAWLGVLLLAGAIACTPEGVEAPGRAGPSALLITLDTTRADALGAYGGPEGLTPALDRIAREGVVFDSARTVAPITLPAHASILTGLVPPRHGVRDNGWSPLPASADTLAERARAAGLATGAFVAAIVLDPAYGLDQGFDVYDAPERPVGRRDASIAYRPGPLVAERAALWLASLDPDARFFVWVHLFDPHFPLQAPGPFVERAGGDRYLAEVAHADAAVGRLLEALERTDRSRDTWIVAVGDHGEGRGDHGESAHGVFCFDSTLRVPLLVRPPDVPAATPKGLPSRGSPSAAVASVVDVFPTIAAALGLEAPSDLDGVSLLGPPAAGRGIYFESFYGHLQFGWAPFVGWLDAGGKYLRGARDEYYDVRADPGEQRDLAGPGTDWNAYRAPIRATLAAPTLVSGDAAAPAPSAEVARQLEALGYASSGRTAADAIALPDPFAEPPLPDPHARGDEADAFHRALTAASRGDLDTTIAVLRGVLAENPDNPSALHYLAAALIDRGRCPQALLALERLEATGRMRPTSLANTGTCLLRTGRVAESIAYFERALALDPRSHGATVGLERARRELEPGS